MLFCLKNFIVKKWGFVLSFLILFCCKTHFLKVLKVLKVLFYFLKGIGVNFTLDPPKRGFKKKESSKQTPQKEGSKREFHKEFLISKHVIQIHAIKPAVLELSA